MEWIIFILVILVVGSIGSSISEANKEAKRKLIIAQNEKEKKELMKNGWHLSPPSVKENMAN